MRLSRPFSAFRSSAPAASTRSRWRRPSFWNDWRRRASAIEPFAGILSALKLDVESPGKLLENLLGYIHIQEELSMVPPLVLDPQPGEMILDLCASPGSKTDPDLRR